MPGRRNRRRRNLNRRISYSDEGEVTIQPEINKKKTGLGWKARRPRSFKFVDDGMMVTKVNMDGAQAVGAEKIRHDLLSRIFSDTSCERQSREE